MCTALSFKTKDHYFGRTLDIDMSYGEKICVMPRRFPLRFCRMGEMDSHFAMIGMAAVVSGTPLYYDAVNERGLGMAGLNFPKNAHYFTERPECDNVAPFEFIPWVLGRCATVEEAKALLSRINLADIPFSRELPPAALHWIISDREKSIVVESVKTGIKIHRNPLGVMTNNPPFEYQMFNLNNYRGLCRETVENRFSDDLELDIYCQGLGGLGLPGDVSSMSRFVRAAFNSRNSVCREDENSSVSRFFHIMGSVEMIEGCCRTDAGTWDKTVYTSCVNTDRGLYYYTTYGNRQINCVNMYGENLDGGGLSVFDLNESENILYQN